MQKKEIGYTKGCRLLILSFAISEWADVIHMHADTMLLQNDLQT